MTSADFFFFLNLGFTPSVLDSLYIRQKVYCMQATHNGYSRCRFAHHVPQTKSGATWSTVSLFWSISSTANKVWGRHCVRYHDFEQSYQSDWPRLVVVPHWLDPLSSLFVSSSKGWDLSSDLNNSILVRHVRVTQEGTQPMLCKSHTLPVENGATKDTTWLPPCRHITEIKTYYSSVL